MLGDVDPEIVLAALAEGLAVAAPDVLGSPVPAFPAVRLPGLNRKAAQQVQQVRLAAMRGVNNFTFPVSVALGKDGCRTVFLIDAFEFLGDEVGCLIPGNPHIFGLAAVLRIAFAFRVPVHALQREFDPVRRGDPFFIGITVGGIQCSIFWFKSFAPDFQPPFVNFFFCIFLSEIQRSCPDNSSVADFHLLGVRATAVPA